ncbi:MAG: hypothetical protein CL693_10345 [Cellvibrionaceae bacterium]|nr:hypothetical protein [Cellvibrionaceae bacterium]|tara:strand:- start:2098 stop:3108 length:1011 start_codon:yes stop_codon:yes gene_type:complete
MSKVEFWSDQGCSTRVELREGQSLLEGLLSAGQKIPNSCRAGLCHACLMRATSDSVIPSAAQLGLSKLQCQQHMLLACQCFPQQALSVSLPEHDDDWLGTVSGLRKYNDQVLELSLKVDGHWQAGQHVLLWRDEVHARPYSIASRCDADKQIVLHIKRHRQGLVSDWCHDQLAIGDTVGLSKPEGHCCYPRDDGSAELILVATGTGLAPLYGVLLEAFAQGHEGNISLYIGETNVKSFYLIEELLELADSHSNLSVHLVLSESGVAVPSKWPLLVGELASLVVEKHPRLRGVKVFLCGNPRMVEELTKRCFFAGARRGDILSDAFVSAVQTPQVED